MNCKEGAIQLIDQIIEIIDVVPTTSYADPLEVFGGSTYGKHFRHIYDFFNCLVEQCGCQKVDYALRMRNEAIETSQETAISHFSEIKKTMADLCEEAPLEVYADFAMINGERPKVQTSIGREIMYAYDHAVHHLAIVKIGLRTQFPDLEINNNIGVAASTIEHQLDYN